MKHVSSSISLIGLMGAGKTTVGKKLAKRLGFPFIDTDSQIAQQTGLSISQIFTLHGEETFRRLEREQILSLLATSPPWILSLGGGAFNDLQTRTTILEKTFTIWLNPSLEILVNRLTASATPRPLLWNQNPHTVLSRLLWERGPFYAQAHLTIQTDTLCAQEIIKHIVAHVSP